VADRPLPFPVDGTVTWETLAPDPDDLILVAGGVALTEPVDMAAAFLGLWPSHAAARPSMSSALRAL
jgi:hypothetical protein